MLRARHWMALVFAGWLSNSPLGLLRGQDSTDAPLPSSGSSSGGTSATPGGTPASSFGSPSTSDSAAGGTPTSSFGSPSTTTPATSPGFSFGSNSPSAETVTPPAFGIPGSSPRGTQPPATGSPASTSTLTGEGGGGTLPPSQAVPSFTVPGAYGQAAQTFVPGTGRLAKPRFTYTGSVSLGYDDNPLSTPYNGIDRKAVTQRVEVEPATADSYVLIPDPRPRVPQANGQRPNLLVLIPGQKAKFEDVVLSPAVKAEDPKGSPAARVTAGMEIQFANRRTVFTMSLSGNATYYFDRTGDPEQYNGSLSLIFAHRLTPRLQLSASVSLAYLSQPDLTRLNTPTQNVGDYFNANSKLDLSYRWSPRFSTVTSVGLSNQIYIEKTADTGSFYSFTLGTEARWLWKPRITLLGEVRYGTSLYNSSSDRNSSSVFLLVGGELTLSRQFTATARFGQQLNTFAESGQTATSPYLETSLAYRYSRTGYVSWNTRFGFEEPGSATSTVLVARSGISAVQAFSARTRGNLALNAVHRLTEDDQSDTSITENTFSIDLGLEYTMSRHTTLTATYSFINNITSTEGQDYLRNQLFLGMQYSF